MLKRFFYFADKGPSSQSHGFSSTHVHMWQLDQKEGWVPKNWCFWTVVFNCGEKTLESPLDCKEIKPVNPKGYQSWYSLEGLMLKLKLQYFGHLMQRANSLEKTLMLGKLKAGGEGDDRGWDSWMASPTWWIWVWASSGRWWRTGKPEVLQSMGSQRVGHDLPTEQRTTDVLRYNWSTIQLIHYKHTVWWILLHLYSCATITAIIQKFTCAHLYTFVPTPIWGRYESDIVTEPNLCTAKPIYWCWIIVKKSIV